MTIRLSCPWLSRIPGCQVVPWVKCCAPLLTPVGSPKCSTSKVYSQPEFASGPTSRIQSGRHDTPTSGSTEGGFWFSIPGITERGSSGLGPSGSRRAGCPPTNRRSASPPLAGEGRGSDGDRRAGMGTEGEQAGPRSSRPCSTPPLLPRSLSGIVHRLRLTASDESVSKIKQSVHSPSRNGLVRLITSPAKRGSAGPFTLDSRIQQLDKIRVVRFRYKKHQHRRGIGHFAPPRRSFASWSACSMSALISDSSSIGQIARRADRSVSFACATDSATLFGKACGFVR